MSPVATLRALLDGLGMNLGQPLHEGASACAAGTMATSLHRTPQFGLFQAWLIPAEAAIFATFTMGSLETAKADLADAMSIMQSAYFEDGEDLR